MDFGIDLAVFLCLLVFEGTRTFFDLFSRTVRTRSKLLTLDFIFSWRFSKHATVALMCLSLYPFQNVLFYNFDNEICSHWKLSWDPFFSLQNFCSYTWWSTCQKGSFDVFPGVMRPKWSFCGNERAEGPAGNAWKYLEYACYETGCATPNTGFPRRHLRLPTDLPSPWPVIYNSIERLRGHSQYLDHHLFCYHSWVPCQTVVHEESHRNLRQY